MTAVISRTAAPPLRGEENVVGEGFRRRVGKQMRAESRGLPERHLHEQLQQKINLPHVCIGAI